MSHHPAPEMDTEGDVIVHRIGAKLIDWFVLSIPAGILFVPVALLLGVADDSAASMIVFLFLFVVTLVYAVLQYAYFIATEARWGQTLGKRLLDIVVVTEDGEPISLGEATIRNLLLIVDSQMNWLVGLAAMLLTDRHQRVGDVVAETVVVKTAE